MKGTNKMGFFSWKTQDTDRSISNRYSVRETFTVYMVNPLTGEYWQEDNYEGYGVFGGKDFYELLTEINGKKTRDEGIDIAFGRNPYISPILVEDLDKWEKYKGRAPKNCKYQGFFYESVEELENNAIYEVKND